MLNQAWIHIPTGIHDYRQLKIWVIYRLLKSPYYKILSWQIYTSIFNWSVTLPLDNIFDITQEYVKTHNHETIGWKSNNNQL